MPGRQHPLLNGQIYHVFNKTIDGRRVFINDAYNKLALETVSYYRSSQAIMRFSNYRKLPSKLKYYYEQKIYKADTFRVSIVAFVLMPTHYHFLLRQNFDSGISTFLSQIQNSYTRYYNLKNERKGQIFLDRFKSKPIYNDEQFKHTSRYIHLNPYSGGIASTIFQLENFSWSSFREYLDESIQSICDKSILLSFFNNDIGRYRKFVLNNKEHQKMLEYCKYTNKW